MSYLILKLLCPLSISRSRGEVVHPFVVILVHCVKRVTAVREDGWRKERQTGGQRNRKRQEKLGVSEILRFSFYQTRSTPLSDRISSPLSFLESEE